MFGFFFSSQSTEQANQVVRTLSFDAFCSRNKIEQNCLYLFDTAGEAQLVKSDGRVLYAIGTLVYERTWGKRALEKIADRLGKGDCLRDIVPQTSGQFCLVAHHGEETYIVTDRLASFPIYRLESGSTIQIANILPLLLKHNRVGINPQGLAEYLSFDYCLECTCFNEIQPLKMGTVYHFGKRNEEHQYDRLFHGITFEKYKKLDEAAALVEEMFRSNISFLGEGERPFADLTGGFDGRLACTLLRSQNVAFTTGICGEQMLHETQLARKVADILGVEFRDDFQIQDRELFRETVRTHMKIASGVPILFHSSELINYYQRIKENHPIHSTGFGGSQVCYQWIKKLSLLSRKCSIASLLDRKFKYLDVLDRRIINQEEFRTAMTEKIQTMLERIGSDRFTHVSNYLGLFTFTKWYHGALINTHNCILPFYSPYLEGNLFRLLTETSFSLKRNHTLQRAILTRINPEVSLVMTTHGYNANLNTKDILGLLKRSSKDVMRQAIFQSRLLRNLRYLVERLAIRGKPRTTIADSDRKYWVTEVQSRYCSDMEIFQVVNAAKLKSALTQGLAGTQFLAKLVYLNDLFREYSVKTGP